MGFAAMIAPCISCGQVFMFNPYKVPSIRVKGKREPVCRRCVELANPRRKAAGLAVIVINPDAYEPMDENEL